MKSVAKSERQKIIDKGNFGMYHKPLAKLIGLEAAVLLDFLIYKYDYFVGKKGKYKMIGNYKAFYITYSDIEEATCIKVSKLGRNIESNPINILIGLGLIFKKTIQATQLKTTYYVLFFKKIQEAYDEALLKQDMKRKAKKQSKDEKTNELLKSKNKLIDEFIEINLIAPKNNLKTYNNSILQNCSMDDVKTPPLIVQNQHITKNKKTKNKMTKNNILTSKNTDENTFSDEEVDDMLSHKNSLQALNYVNPDILYQAIVNVREGAITPKDFFNTIVDDIIKDKFKGFKISVEDELLINELIINNPMFDIKDDYLTENDIINEFNDEDDFNNDKYDLHYNRLWEKILKNCERINQDKLKARFGNIFVGVKEISDNYAPFIERY
jgi:hypothetical protein